MVAATRTVEECVDPLDFKVRDVTGLRTLQFRGVDGHRFAGDIAMSVAQRMGLPTETRYSFRDDSRARMLLDEEPLGRQVGQSEQVELVVIPKAHLG